MTTYTISLTGPLEEKLIRLAHQHGYSPPGRFLRHMLIEYPEDKPAQKESLSLTEKDIAVFRNLLNTKEDPPQRTYTKISPANLELIRKVYFLGNYYRSRGTAKDREVCPKWMNKLISGYNLTPTGIGIIERDFRTKIALSNNPQQWLVQNPDFPEADEYIRILT